jgi:conjugative transposon TraK protein
MEFKTLRNIENSFRQIRLYAIVFTVLCLGLSGYAVWESYRFAREQREKVYVLDQGKSLMLALSQDASVNRPVEAREHVRRFHELFFTLAPDKAAIESNMKRAFNLADKSAFDYYKDLSEKGYYNRIISGNVQQRIEVDSVQCDFDKYPYSVRTYAREYIIRASNVTRRSLVTSCLLVNSVRSDDNPQGFNIEQFRVLENKDVEVVERK